MKKEKMSKSDATVSWPRCGAETRSQSGCRPMLLQERRHSYENSECKSPFTWHFHFEALVPFPAGFPAAAAATRPTQAIRQSGPKAGDSSVFVSGTAQATALRKRSKMRREVRSGHLGWTVSAALGMFSPPPLPASQPQGAALLSQVGYLQAF